MRRKLVVGNWKMHGNRAQVTELLQELISSATQISQGVDVGVCPSFVHLGLVKDQLAGSKLILGAQDLNEQPESAVTGEVAGSMLFDLGVRYVIVGHSERREKLKESDDLIADKLVSAQVNGLTPILCIGESLEQRQEGVTEETVIGQLDVAVDKVGIRAFNDVIIAYEPVWAIGTGHTATPEQAQEVHRILRDHLAELNVAVAEAVRIIYGGSVKADNAKELFRSADIDGGLVGAASLKAEEFISICKSAG